MQIFPVLILGFLLAGLPVQAQSTKRKPPVGAKKGGGPTLEETQAFIKEKMEQWGACEVTVQFPPENDKQLTVYKTYRTRIDFDGNLLIIKEEVIEKPLWQYVKFGIIPGSLIKTNWKINIDLQSLDIDGIRIMNNTFKIPINNRSTMECMGYWEKSDNEEWKEQHSRRPNGPFTTESWPFSDTAQPERLLAALKRLVELKGGKRSAF